MLRTKRANAGSWTTLEWFWNTTGTAFFREPRGGIIKIRYGVGWFGWNSQRQTLDGNTIKKLVAGRASVAYARMQIHVVVTGDVRYDVYPGDVAITSPEIPF